MPVLEPLSERHAPALAAAAAASPEVARWLSADVAPATPETARAFVAAQARQREAGAGEAFALCAPAGACVGLAWLSALNPRHGVANVGYWVRADRTGAGHATAAVRLLAAHAFGVLGLQRLELVIAPGNAASLRVAEKVGAVREGVLRHRLRRAGAPQDAVLYSLLPGDLGPAEPG